LALCDQLLRHLIGYDTTERGAAKQVWALWLHAADNLDIIFRHLRNVIDRLVFAIEALGLDSVDWPILLELLHQIAVDVDAAANWVDEEQRVFAAVGLQWHQ
jgi:hypothetical protein